MGSILNSPLAERPSKIIAVHLNYRSAPRSAAARRQVPSYFLKPPSSLAADGDAVVRPLGYRAALLRGRDRRRDRPRARNVSPEEAARLHRLATPPANDLGVYDLRWADRGSNVMAKGSDGFTPIGPPVAGDGAGPARAAPAHAGQRRGRPGGRRRRTCIFPFGRLVADLSRFMTLEPGDVILTGTPGRLAPGRARRRRRDRARRRRAASRNTIVEADAPLAPIGAHAEGRPRAVRRRQRLRGRGAPRRARCRGARAPCSRSRRRRSPRSCASAGSRNTFLAGLRPTRPDLRLLGYAHTLRYVPLREDVRDADRAELNAQKRAVESIGPDEVLVIEARGEPGAGHDRRHPRRCGRCARGAAGIVTDGGLRDSPARRRARHPDLLPAPHAAVLGLMHYPLEIQRAGRLRRHAGHARRRDRRRRRGRARRARARSPRRWRATRWSRRSARRRRSSASTPASRSAASIRCRRAPRRLRALASAAQRGAAMRFAADPRPSAARSRRW